MAEQEEAKTTTAEETCCAKHKCKVMHKVFGLKGLSTIYKILSVLMLVYLVYVIAGTWYIAYQNQFPDKSLLTHLTVSYIITYGFFALVLITVSRVLKTLKKIKHAVEHK